MPKFFLCLLALSLAAALSFSAGAQKLPSLQAAPVKAPKNVKIDGKALEWNNQFQAFNRTTDLYYTIAHDDDNLYLIVQAKDLPAVKKLIGGGITLSLRASRNKYDSSKVTVRYPVLKLSVCSQLGYLLTEEPTATETQAKVHQADSLNKLFNYILSVNSKEFYVSGLKEVRDTLSVYNAEGFKTGLQLDKQKSLTYELAIPLKHISFAKSNNQQPFYYQITLNGLNSIQKPAVFNTAEGIVTVTTTPRSLSAGESSYEQMSYPTDFWGSYVIRD
jgi:hypothetical protein